MGLSWHDDVIKWKHFTRYWSFVRGIHRSPVNSPHKRQYSRALIFSFICACTSDWVNNRKAGDLRRYRAHYDVTVMGMQRGGSEYQDSHTQVTLKLSYGVRAEISKIISVKYYFTVIASGLVNWFVWIYSLFYLAIGLIRGWYEVCYESTRCIRCKCCRGSSGELPTSSWRVHHICLSVLPQIP